ncbi:MAG: hypothetical protein ABI977_15655 [Acidobacteriota bacterium]
MASPGRKHSKKIDLALFDLDKERGEVNNIAGKPPQVIQELMTFVEQARQDLAMPLFSAEAVRPSGGVVTLERLEARDCNQLKKFAVYQV